MSISVRLASRRMVVTSHCVRRQFSQLQHFHTPRLTQALSRFNNSYDELLKQIQPCDTLRLDGGVFIFTCFISMGSNVYHVRHTRRYAIGVVVRILADGIWSFHCSIPVPRVPCHYLLVELATQNFIFFTVVFGLWIARFTRVRVVAN